MTRGKLLVRGKSKEIYEYKTNIVYVKLIPSLTSFTYNRDALVPETERLRLDFYEMAAAVLEEGGAPTAFLERVEQDAYLAEWCLESPFETIVKNRACGSTIRKYPSLFEEGHEFREPVVKFDFRTSPEDLPIADDYLRAYGIDCDMWKRLALKTNSLLKEWLSPRVLIDFCLVIGENARRKPVIVSEVSPDCMRLRSECGESLDKDLFRSGLAAGTIIHVWSNLVRSLRAAEEGAPEAANSGSAVGRRAVEIS
jgi:phosphoribosylaminoimidazole-succinocarboxamide synthase